MDNLATSDSFSRSLELVISSCLIAVHRKWVHHPVMVQQVLSHFSLGEKVKLPVHILHRRWSVVRLGVEMIDQLLQIGPSQHCLVSDKCLFQTETELFIDRVELGLK